MSTSLPFNASLADVPNPLPWEVTIKLPTVFSSAIFNVLLSSSAIVSPGINSPKRVVTNKSLPEEKLSSLSFSITPYAPLVLPTIYLPAPKPRTGACSKIILVKNSGLKYEKLKIAL